MIFGQVSNGPLFQNFANKDLNICMKICNIVVRKWHPLEFFPIIHLFWQEASLRKMKNNLMRSQLWTFNSQCTDCSALLSIRQYMRGYFLLAQQARHSEAGQQVHLRWCRPNHWQRVRCLWKPSLSCADMEMHCTALSCSFLNWDVWDGMSENLTKLQLQTIHI